MTFEVLIVVIGIILVFPAIFSSGKGRIDSAGVLGPYLRVILAFLGIGLVMYGGFSYGIVNQQGQMMERVTTAGKLDVPLPAERVQITSPLDGEAVPCRVLTMGVYPEGHEKDIWVLLRPSDELYYPQSDHTNTSFKRNGEWQVITRYGGSLGEAYDVIVYEADSEASGFFTATIEEWKENLFYPGLTDGELPEGATELDRIIVTLSEHCRGVF